MRADAQSLRNIANGISPFGDLFDRINLEIFCKSGMAHDRLLVLIFRRQGVYNSRGYSAVQKQLAVSSIVEVQLKPYLYNLCESLGASMISNRAKITVEADDASATQDISVSLGLIVTELVVNALKHAFPRHRSGLILVKYTTAGKAWSLSITNNGIGIPDDPASKPGLGTSIVEALAKQLNAEVTIQDAKPGTRVSVAHSYDCWRLIRDHIEVLWHIVPARLIEISDTSS